MFEFTVERKSWLRGEGSLKSYLYRSNDKKMCCLGFLGRALGINITTMRGKLSPYEIPEKYPKSLVTTDKYNTDICETISDTNDNIDIDEPTREKDLTKLFKQINITVTFED